MRILYSKALNKFGYEFFIRKRIERRLWSVIGAHLKALE